MDGVPTLIIPPYVAPITLSTSVAELHQCRSSIPNSPSIFAEESISTPAQYYYTISIAGLELFADRGDVYTPVHPTAMPGLRFRAVAVFVRTEALAFLSFSFRQGSCRGCFGSQGSLQPFAGFVSWRSLGRLLDVAISAWCARNSAILGGLVAQIKKSTNISIDRINSSKGQSAGYRHW